MPAKLLIVIAILGIAGLVVFNLINTPKHDLATAEADTVNESSASVQSDESIANKPLGQQPKAMVDQATAEIERAQQIEHDNMAQMASEAAQ
ncbi:hypothetical protein [Psychrobacter pygoscelis]|uniref:hypothetical protein n=1 Tax=Psychrobacter pygoscelis TaxID=2488563 RepID=UPI00103DF9AD|nr:hypothetical protein [Psychrobacter pygoscelis]